MFKWVVIKKGLRFNQFVERRMIWLMVFALALGAVFHNLMVFFKPATSYIFAYITLVMALGCSSRDFRNVFKTPGLLLSILGLLHIILPIFAFGFGKLILPGQPQLQAGVVLGTATPIGVASVIWAGLSGGNVALALTAVAVDTLLSPLTVPLIMLGAMGRTIHFDIPQLIIGLTWMIVIPTIIGIVIHDLSRGRVSRNLRFINGPLSKLFLALVIAINLAVAWDSLHLIKTALTAIFALILVIGCSGYLLGYGVARLAKLAPENVNTFIFSVGMRNNTAGLVMALQYFTELTAIPVVFLILFQQPLAAISHRFLVVKKEGQPVISKTAQKYEPEI